MRDMREQAATFIRAQSREGEVLVLAPSNEAARDLVRESCQTALIGVHATSPRQYARDLIRSARVCINHTVHQALCARISQTEKLTYFAPVARTPGFPKALARTIRELRLQNVRPPGDAGTLLLAYERELERGELADDAAMFRMARGQQLMPTLLFDLDLRFAAEREFIHSLGASTAVAFVPAGNPGSALESVQKYLFTEEIAPAREADESFKMFASATESLECVEIARRVLQVASKNAGRFDECAVLLRQPERYAPLFAEAFRRAGLPVWFASGSRRPDVAGRALLTLLHCAREGLSASRMGEYLSLRQVPEFNPAAWESIVSNAHVLGGAERWARRLDAVTRNSEALEQLKDFVLPLIDRLHKLPKRAMWGEWLDALYELAASALRSPEGVVEALDELQPMSDIGPVEIDEVLLLLADHLGSQREREDESRYGKVWIGPIEQAHGMRFRHVFVPGIAEGAFPRPLREDPLLLNADRRALGLAEVTEHEEQQLLLMAARCASESLTISYGRIDLETGRPRVPSLYLYAAARAAGGGAEIERVIWPGADPVDDVEYDAIALEHRKPGSGAYLTKVNSYLYDSLLSRYRRWDPEKKWQGADGLNLIDPALDDYRLTKAAYSISTLETYAACPYKFFLRGMMALRPAELPEPLQRLDPAVRGEIFHRLQFELLRALQMESLLPVLPDRLPACLETLGRVMTRVAEDEAEKRSPATPQVWREEMRRMGADLRGWVTKMAEEPAGWTPLAFELSFGRKLDEDHDARSTPDPVVVLDGYLLQGSVDLVEEDAGGLLRVTDHKTGTYPQMPPRTIGKGEVLQPALYAMAVQQILGKPVRDARLYYSTLRANFRSCSVALSNTHAQEVLEAIDTAVGNGLLPANPREEACEHCEYRPICGPYEEYRVKRKPRDATLTRIRGLE